MDDQFPESENIERRRIQAAYAKRHGIRLYSWFNPSYVFMAQGQERQMLVALKEHGFGSLGTTRILEIGCGSGYWLREFIKWGAKPNNITGVDLLSDRVDIARKLCPEGVEIKCGSAGKLDSRGEIFDIVLQSTVFSSILNPPLRQQIAREMLRVLKGNGAIFWYDFHVNNPRNPDVQGINKRAILQLFPGCRIELKRITLAPPLARVLAPYSLMTCHFLEKLKVFNTHYLAVIRKA